MEFPMQAGDDSWRQAQSVICLPIPAIHDTPVSNSSPSIAYLRSFNGPANRRRVDVGVGGGPSPRSALMAMMTMMSAHKKQKREQQENLWQWQSLFSATNRRNMMTVAGAAAAMDSGSRFEPANDGNDNDDSGVALEGSGRAGLLRWQFKVASSLRGGGSSSQACDVVAAIDFDEEKEQMATGGIARKICIYNYEAIAGSVSPSKKPGRRKGRRRRRRRSFEEEQEEEGEEEVGTSTSRRDKGALKGPGIQRRSFEEEEDEEEDDDEEEDNDRRSLGVRVVDQDRECMRAICTPAKLSSLRWRPLSGGRVIVTGDYDGMVGEWDVEHGACLSERYEHNGQRVWSVDYSDWFPFLCASASGDGTVRIWSGNGCERSIGVIRSPAGNSMCSAQFSPSPSSLPHLAVACADSNVYLYDLRQLSSPFSVLRSHSRATSYVRFLNPHSLVSASIDSTLKLWNLSSSSSPTLSQTFNRHRNMRNFVGLSCIDDGTSPHGHSLLACGSETNEVFVYESSSSPTLSPASAAWTLKFPANRHHFCQPSSNQDDCAFISAVAWRKDKEGHISLIAANSDGIIQIIQASSPHAG